MAETKSPKKTAPPKAKAPDETGAPQVVGPGVMKRPKRESEGARGSGDEGLSYTPSEQVFRRRK